MNTQTSTRLLTGATIIAVGTALLLQTLGVESIGQLIGTWWPLLVIAIGLINLVGTPRQFVWPLFTICAGIALQFRSLGYLDFNVWSTLWPLAIIAIGISIIVRPVLPSASAASDDQTDAFVAFSGSKLRTASHNYQGGQLTVWFGGIEVDLNGAQIKDRAHLDVFVAFGGVEVRVPEGWTVKTSGLPLFGGWENKAAVPAKPGPVLEVTGTCLFGGIEIKN